jgi:hypothetical protein
LNTLIKYTTSQGKNKKRKGELSLTWDIWEYEPPGRDHLRRTSGGSSVSPKP